VKGKTIIKGVGCPVARTVTIIGDRWTALIIKELYLHNSRKFQDIMDVLNSISPNILSNRIKKLLEYDILYSQVYSEHPPRSEYLLTKKGKELCAVIISMQKWGELYTKEE
jgi:DNA-binding HxlR family transcriptional regulator